MISIGADFGIVGEGLPCKFFVRAYSLIEYRDDDGDVERSFLGCGDNLRVKKVARGIKFETTAYIAGLVCFSVFMYFLYTMRIVGANRDMWGMLFFLEYFDQGQLTVAHVFEKFTGVHVLAIPKIFYFLDYKLFHGQGYFILAVSVICFCASYFIIISQVEKILSNQQLDSHYKIMFIFCTAVLFFNGWQIPNLLSAFQVQWYLALLFSVLAFHFLKKEEKKIQNYWIAITCAVTASLCNFSGVVTLFIVLAVMFYAIKNIKARICILSVSLMAAWFFSPEKAIYRLSGTDLLYLTKADFLAKAGVESPNFFPYFFLRFFEWLGNPFSRISGVLGVFFGVVVFVVLVCSAMESFNKNKKINFFVLLTIYSLGAIFSIAIGRYDDLDAGYQDRFVTIYTLSVVSFFYWILFSCQFIYKNIKIFILFSYMLCLLFLSVVEVDEELNNTILRKKADINILNGIFYNMAYNKTANYSNAIGFNPMAYFSDYLKSNDLDVFFGRKTAINKKNITGNACSGWINKSFYLPKNNIRDYYLELWDNTSNVPLLDWYLLKDDQVVFYGMTYATRYRWLPLRYQERRSLMSYTSIPGAYHLKDFDLVGHNAEGDYCKIDLSHR